EKHTRSAGEALGMAYPSACLPHQRSVVDLHVVVGGVALADHPPDKRLIADFHLPAECLGPPVGERVRVGTVLGYLKVERHKPRRYLQLRTESVLDVWQDSRHARHVRAAAAAASPLAD